VDVDATFTRDASAREQFGPEKPALEGTTGADPIGTVRLCSNSSRWEFTVGQNGLGYLVFFSLRRAAQYFFMRSETALRAAADIALLRRRRFAGRASEPAAWR